MGGGATWQAELLAYGSGEGEGWAQADGPSAGEGAEGRAREVLRGIGFKFLSRCRAF